MYRDGAAITPLTRLLPGGDPGKVLAAMGFLNVVDAHAGAVTEELDAALGEVDRQLARLQQEQVEVNDRTAAGWQATSPSWRPRGWQPRRPPRWAIRRAVCPPGMVPVAAADGTAERGAAQVPRQPSSLLVLPAETLTAVTAATGELACGPGTAGPASWSCGSLVQAVHRSAGIPLPGGHAALFAETTAVAPADVLPGDLVFLGAADAGLRHVGIARAEVSVAAPTVRRTSGGEPTCSSTATPVLLVAPAAPTVSSPSC